MRHQLSSHPLFADLPWLSNSIKNGLLQQLAAKEIHPFLILASLSSERKKALLEKIAIGWISPSIDALLPIKAFVHPDIIIVKPQGKSGVYVIDSIREIVKEVSLQPFQNGRRVILIEDGEKISQAAANALLLLLEEPPKGTLFLMTISQPQKVMPTILSRSEMIRIPASSLREEVFDMQPLLEKAIASLFSEDPLYRPSYQEIQRAVSLLIELYEKSLDEVKKRSSDMDSEEREVFLSLQKTRTGEFFIDAIYDKWKKGLLIRGVELSGVTGKSRRFADGSLLSFHEAFQENSLSLHFQEVVLKLLLSIFGYTSKQESFSLLLQAN